MFASRVPTRLLATLLFLSVALFAVVALPPHMGTFDAVGAFVVAGLILAKLTRMATRRITPGGQLY
jgi:divalent metal cation (Fe/Co/Zn/Cd) transporter